MLPAPLDVGKVRLMLERVFLLPKKIPIVI